MLYSLSALHLKALTPFPQKNETKNQITGNGTMFTTKCWDVPKVLKLFWEKKEKKGKEKRKEKKRKEKKKEKKKKKKLEAKL